MKKVRLFAVAAAMGMFASSVSAATQIGPVTTKTSGSFAWGEFASVMKVDMGDKVVAPQVTVTATTEGRTTDIDYATYKTATGLVKSSTCYLGFTNTVAKDTNVDGIADMPFYVSQYLTSSGKMVVYGSVKEAVLDYIDEGGKIYGDAVLAAGQKAIEDVFRISGSDETLTDFEQVFDYLEESGFFTVTRNDDDIITSVSLASKTFYMFDKDGNELESQPLGTVYGTYFNTSNRSKDTEDVKEDLAKLFLYNEVETGDRLAALKDLYVLEGGTAASITAVDPANLLKVFGTTYTMTTGSEFVTGMAAVAAGNVKAGKVSKDNPYLENYYYYDASQYNKGSLIAGAAPTMISGADIATYGAVIVVEYDSRNEMYVPDATKTGIINDVVKYVEGVQDLVDFIIADDSYTNMATAKALIPAGTQADIKAQVEAVIDTAAADTNAGVLAVLDANTEAASIAAWTAAHVQAAADATHYSTASVDEVFYGTATSAADTARAAAAKDNGAIKSLSQTSVKPTSLADLFDFAGLDYHPVPATQTVKDTFINPGFISVVEFGSVRRKADEDFNVLINPRKQATETKAYATILSHTFNADTVTFDSSAAVWSVGANPGQVTDVTFANKTTDVDDTNEAIFFKNVYGALLSTEADDGVAHGSYTYQEIYNKLYGVGAVARKSGVYAAIAPENDSEYIVINMPIDGGNNQVTPVSRSLTKMTANYKNGFTNEEIMVHLVELDTNNGTKGSFYYPAVETEEDAIKFLETVLEVGDSITYASKYGFNSSDYAKATYTWADGTTEKMLPNSYLSSPASTQCTYSTNKGSDVKTEAASVSFDASKVDTTKAGVYTATLTAKAGETTETKDVTVVVAPKYSRTWDNKGRVSTLKAYWLSGNLYAEYKYTYNADNTITVVSTFYREDGVTVADTATTTK